MQNKLVNIVFKILLYALIVVFLSNSQIMASTIFLEGEHQVSFQFPNFADAEMPSFISYSDNGFSQKIIKSELWQTIQIDTNLSKLRTKATYPIKRRKIPLENRVFLKPSHLIQSRNTKIMKLKKELLDKYHPRTVADVVKTVLTYVKDNVRYNLKVPQNALSALELKQGSCVGISCLGIALLRSAGIPARSVLGYNPPGHNWGQKETIFGVKQTGGGFHMWMEVYYPDAGWVMCDPANSLNHIDVYHWVMEIAKNEKVNPTFLKRIGNAMKAARTSIEAIKENKTVHVVGLQKGLPKNYNIYARITPSDNVQFVGTLKAKIFQFGTKKAIKNSKLFLFRGNSKYYYIYNSNKDGIVDIPTVSPGNLSIQCLAKGFAKSKKIYFSISRGETVEKQVFLKPGGEIFCKVVDQKGRPVSAARIVLWQGTEGIVHALKQNGTFIFEGIIAGNYYVSVKKHGFIEKKYQVKVKPSVKSKIVIILEKKD